MTLSLLSDNAGDPLGRFREALRAAEAEVRGLGADALADALGTGGEGSRRGLWTRLYAGRDTSPGGEEDRLLEVEEAARRLGDLDGHPLSESTTNSPSRSGSAEMSASSAQGISPTIATRQEALKYSSCV